MIGTPVIRLGMDLAAYLRNPFLSDGQMDDLVQAVLKFAQERLTLACERIGIPINDLSGADRILTAYWSVKEAPEAHVGDLQACEVFDACADALARNRLDQAGRDRLVVAFSRLDDDLKAHGAKFRPGRKPGTVSKVRMFVRRFLAKNHAAKPAAIWEALKARPPKGVTVYESPRLGKYIQTDGALDTGYATFRNIVSAEKKGLLAPPLPHPK